MQILEMLTGRWLNLILTWRWWMDGQVVKVQPPIPSLFMTYFYLFSTETPFEDRSVDNKCLIEEEIGMYNVWWGPKNFQRSHSDDEGEIQLKEELVEHGTNHRQFSDIQLWKDHLSRKVRAHVIIDFIWSSTKWESARPCRSGTCEIEVHWALCKTF